MALRTRSVERLLDAVDEVMLPRGYSSTPVDAVLDRAGVSAATMYRGFASKEALVAAALDRRLERWRSLVVDAIAAADGPADQVLALFDAADAFAAGAVGSRWCAFLGAAAEYAEPPAEIGAAIAADTEFLRATLRDLAGQIPCEAPEDVAESLVVVLSGHLAMRLRAPSPTSGVTGRDVAAALLRAATHAAGQPQAGDHPVTM